MPTHPLHQAIGRLLDVVHDSLPADRRASCTLIKDPACLSGATPNYVRVPQNIPLFCSTAKGNDTEFCNVDALILLGGKIKVIIEIEESALSPTQVFGKFLTSAAALCYIHDADGTDPIHKDERVLFVQVMDTSELKPGSSKREQWRNIEASHPRHAATRFRQEIPSAARGRKRFHRRAGWGRVHRFRERHPGREHRPRHPNVKSIATRGRPM